jgi:hypothetical protein
MYASDMFCEQIVLEQAKYLKGLVLYRFTVVVYILLVYHIVHLKSNRCSINFIVFLVAVPAC